MKEILQSWIAMQDSRSNTTAAAFGKTLREQFGDFPLPGKLELWIIMQEGNTDAITFGRILKERFGDSPLNDSPISVLDRSLPRPIPSKDWTEVPFTPAEERGKIEIQHRSDTVFVRCKDVELTTRRLQVMDLRSRGLGNMAIGERLKRSDKTIDTLLTRVRKPIHKEEEDVHLPTITQFFVHCARVGLLDPNLIPAIKANFDLPAGSWYEEYSEGKPIEDEELDSSGQRPLPRDWTEVSFTLVEERGKIEIMRDNTIHVRCKDVELTWDQLRILTLRSRGFKNQAIASRLGISVRTIDAHFSNARNQVDGEDSPKLTQLYVHCAKIGLLDPNLIPAIKVNFQLSAKRLNGLDE